MKLYISAATHTQQKNYQTIHK